MFKTFTVAIHLMLIGALVVGCEPSETDSGGEGSTSRAATSRIGAAGGVVEGPNGARVEIGAGALSEEVDITITETTNGYPKLGAAAYGMVYAFEPHGLTFDEPVTIVVPHSASSPAQVALFTSEPGESWQKLGSEKLPEATRAQVTHFSYFYNGREVCGLSHQECCTSEDGEDGECSGRTVCVEGYCLPCGGSGGGIGQPCCEGTTLAEQCPTPGYIGDYLDDLACDILWDEHRSITPGGGSPPTEATSIKMCHKKSG